MERCVAAMGLVNAEVGHRARGGVARRHRGLRRRHGARARTAERAARVRRAAAARRRGRSSPGRAIATRRRSASGRRGRGSARHGVAEVREVAPVRRGAGAASRGRAQDRAHAGRIPAPGRHGAQAAPALTPELPVDDRSGRYPRSTVGTVFAIVNQKGGVGKTTTAVNVAACIAEAGWSTLLADVDPQANATLGLGLAEGPRPGHLRGALRHGAGLRRRLPDVDRPAVACCPASPDLAGANVELPRQAGLRARACATRSRTVRDDFAYVLLDCPPSLGPLTVNALVAADRVIVPVQTEYFALEGLAGPARHAVARPARAQPAPHRRRHAADDARRAHAARARRRARGPHALPRSSCSTRSSRATCASARRRATGGR